MNFWYHLCWWLCRIGLFFWHPVFHVTGREQIPAGSCIFCANHSGMADPIWILLALPEKKMIRIMAKQELRRVPFIGWVMEKFRVIFVNRGAHDIPRRRARPERPRRLPAGVRPAPENDL